jgi:hypothetical protein
VRRGRSLRYQRGSRLVQKDYRIILAPTVKRTPISLITALSLHLLSYPGSSVCPEGDYEYFVLLNVTSKVNRISGTERCFR